MGDLIGSYCGQSICFPSGIPLVLLAGLPTASNRLVTAQDPGAAIDIGSRRELFVDHHLIKRLVGTRLRLHQPEPAEAVMKVDRPCEGTTGYGLSVI